MWHWQGYRKGQTQTLLDQPAGPRAHPRSSRLEAPCEPLFSLLGAHTIKSLSVGQDAERELPGEPALGPVLAAGGAENPLHSPPSSPPVKPSQETILKSEEKAGRTGQGTLEDACPSPWAAGRERGWREADTHCPVVSRSSCEGQATGEDHPPLPTMGERASHGDPPRQVRPALSPPGGALSSRLESDPSYRKALAVPLIRSLCFGVEGARTTPSPSSVTQAALGGAGNTEIGVSQRSQTGRIHRWPSHEERDREPWDVANYAWHVIVDSTD